MSIPRSYFPEEVGEEYFLPRNIPTHRPIAIPLRRMMTAQRWNDLSVRFFRNGISNGCWSLERRLSLDRR